MDRIETSKGAGVTKEARRAAAEILAANGNEEMAAEVADLMDQAWDDIEAGR